MMRSEVVDWCMALRLQIHHRTVRSGYCQHVARCAVRQNRRAIVGRPTPASRYMEDIL